MLSGKNIFWYCNCEDAWGHVMVVFHDIHGIANEYDTLGPTMGQNVIFSFHELTEAKHPVVAGAPWKQ